MRVQDTGEDAPASDKAFEGTLTLPADPWMYGALRPEMDLEFRDGKIHVKLRAKKLTNLKAQFHSCLRLYTALTNVKEVLEWKRK